MRTRHLITSDEQWDALRAGGIGASEVGAVLGISPWATPLSLYLEKRGEVVRSRDSEATAFGERFEQATIDEFCARTGKTVDRRKALYVHPLYDFLRCTPDGTVEGENAGVEAKTSVPWKRDAWEDGPPMYIEAQCQHQMCVMGWDRVYVPVYFDSRHFEIFEVVRDEEVICDLIVALTAFWDRVLEGNPPDVDAQDTETLALWWPSSKALKIDLPEGMAEVIERAIDLGLLVKNYEEELERCKNLIKAELKDAEEGWINGVKRVTWKSQSRTALDAKRLAEELPDIAEAYKRTSEFRVMRFKEIKER